MSLNSVFDIAGSGMSAQSIRLNAISSNIANAESAGKTPETTYHAKKPVFSAIKDSFNGNNISEGVKVTNVISSNAPLQLRYDPQHPLADKNGYVNYPNVNLIEEMTDMLSASRSMQTNIEVFETAKTLMQRMLSLGQS